MRTVRQHSLATLLLYCQRDLLAEFVPFLEERGLTLDQWRILAALQGTEGIPMAELASTAVLPPPSLTRNMDRLVERGSVVRAVDRADRRKVVAVLTPAGKRDVAELRRHEREAERAMADRMGRHRFDSLVAELTELVDPL
ncbi:MarR family winged helix-turn-helix transcriptional regulator [Mycobacterium sp. GA-2829]|uniref:MarR family winged helix-turn-helix transcriptional regulator n=1 Tax=Mycobacterium sp. GA-2829 TaxID=1772283 RepID=UPI000746CBBE|nr:MarR family transcriptional regulator [Mycobacterium sp. GA-2829]KUI38563.1 hypothetical protein AU194_08725 [Mycobacterium sp. GA-2829]